MRNASIYGQPELFANIIWLYVIALIADTSRK